MGWTNYIFLTHSSLIKQRRMMRYIIQHFPNNDQTDKAYPIKIILAESEV